MKENVVLCIEDTGSGAGMINRTETQAFAGFVNHYRKSVITMAFRMTGNFEEARDIAQEVFVKYWKAAYSLTINGKSFSLLSRITVNLAIDHLRKKRRRRFLSIDSMPYELMSDTAADAACTQNECVRLIEQASHRLKPKQKACFVMRDIEARPVEEIAAMLNCSENNVKVNLCLARKNMRKWLGSYLKEGE